MTKIAVAGKGGTGKTVLSGLIIISLLRNGKKPVLAVDADPNSTLSEILGVREPRSVVEIVDEIDKIKNNLPAGIEKSKYLEFQLQEAIEESTDFDLLVMGRTEGPGCYCYANHLLREYMERIEKNYPFVVMDNEAGMEHLSRRTTRNIDILFIVSLANKVSLKSAERIYRMSKELDLNIKKTFLVINEFTGVRIPRDFKLFLEPLFTLPHDDNILTLIEEEKGLFEIPSSSPAYRIVKENIDKVM